jgi:hypothetical protein
MGMWVEVSKRVGVVRLLFRGERTYSMVKGRGRGEISICDEVWVADRMRLLDYLDDVWSNIWDLVVMGIDELRSIYPRVKPTPYFSLFSGTPRNKDRPMA